MTKNRLEAFSDGVVAIIITIMVLELKAPHGGTFHDLKEVLPNFLSYVLSFVFIGIYWNNHHHMLQASRRINNGVLWANLHLLFWLSLVPFFTSWVGEDHHDVAPVAAYGVVLLMSAVAYTILQKTILAEHGPESEMAGAIGGDTKGKISLACYASGIGFAFVDVWISIALYVIVALMWLWPDRRLVPLISQNDRS